jgi:hypothetical protein
MNGQSQNIGAIEAQLISAKTVLDNFNTWLKTSKMITPLSILQNLDNQIANLDAIITQAVNLINTNNKDRAKDEFDALYNAFISFDSTFPSQVRIDNLRKFLDAKKLVFYPNLDK